ncbi:MAG: hypothetical protein QXK62_10410 [Thermoproteus sp.]
MKTTLGAALNLLSAATKPLSALDVKSRRYGASGLPADEAAALTLGVRCRSALNGAEL